jgi:PAS domain S-box-containing protein
LDGLPQAVILYRPDALLFANRAALDALGLRDLRELGSHGELARALREASGPDIVLATPEGERRFALAKGTFPWNTGPVEQATLRPLPALEAAPARPARAQPPAADQGPALPEPAAPEALEPAPARELVPAREPAPSREPAPASLPSDAEFRAILDTATDGIALLDARGNIRSFSAGAEALFGYRLAEVAGKPFTDLLTLDSRKVVRNYLSALEDSGLAAVFNDGREVEAVVSQGGTVPLFIAIGRIGQGDGETGGERGFCVVMRDLTQWKKTEAELRLAKETAERASAQKSEFLANISHELRTPLNAILGFSEVMRTERFGQMRNEKYLSYAHDIHESGEHLLSLINDLLDLSKVEAGKFELNFTGVNLGSLIDQCFAILQENATAARVIMRKNVPPTLPHVVADQRSMKQILLNLLSNAIKFTDPGGQVIVSGRLDRSGELTLSVKDTGIGMAAEELKTALMPFRRIESAMRQSRPGTGLGLPLSKALTEANRARFSITSEPRKGTLVEITFPTTRVLAA